MLDSTEELTASELEQVAYRVMLTSYKYMLDSTEELTASVQLTLLLYK